MEGRGVEIDGKEKKLCISEEEEKNVCIEGGAAGCKWATEKKEISYSLTAHQPGNLCLGGHKTSKTFRLEYHGLGGQPFRIPSTEKYTLYSTIEKMKPLQGTTILFGHH